VPARPTAAGALVALDRSDCGRAEGAADSIGVVLHPTNPASSPQRRQARVPAPTEATGARGDPSQRESTSCVDPRSGSTPPSVLRARTPDTWRRLGSRRHPQGRRTLRSRGYVYDVDINPTNSQSSTPWRTGPVLLDRRRCDLEKAAGRVPGRI
jgi:hypothetical protein